MQLSSIPFLLAGLVGAIAWAAARAERHGAITASGRRAIWLLLAGLVAWAVLSGALAARGAYLAPGFLTWLPGLWLPLVPMIFVGLTVAASGTVRRALLGLLDATPPHWLVYLQALRIAALGTLVKTIQGTFPLYFELGVGIPDLVFGLSALVIAPAVRRGAIGWRGLAAWNLIGFAAVAFPSLPLAQMGLPGPLQVFTGPPASETLLVYPMALAPTVVVPIFLMLNLWAAAWLALRRPTLGSGAPVPPKSKMP